MSMTKSSTLALYRAILRCHNKYLNEEMRSLGDAYVKSEFRAHKSVADQNQLDQFFQGWRGYLVHVQSTGARQFESSQDEKQNVKFGLDYDPITSGELNEEQVNQLDKLREEVIKKAK